MKPDLSETLERHEVFVLTANIFSRGGVKTVGDLIALTPTDLDRLLDAEIAAIRERLHEDDEPPERDELKEALLEDIRPILAAQGLRWPAV